MRCKICNQTTTGIQQNLILALPLDGFSGKSTNIQEIVKMYCDWHILDGSSCIHCGSNEVIFKTDITVAGRVLLIQLLPFTISKRGIVTIQKYSIVGVHTTKLQIAQKTYRAISAIFYQGKHDNNHSEHYTCFIKGKKNTFNCIDDNRVISKIQWPRVAKDAFILFFLA